MTKKLSLFLFLVLFTQVFVLAQQKMILRPDNTLEKVTNYFDGRENIMVQQNKHGVQNPAIKTHTLSKSVNGTIDTLFIDVTWGSNFGAFGQDWLMQWYQAPADLIIKQVGFACYDPSYPSVEIKIVKVLWTKAQLLAAGEKQYGYYQATGNGFNNITAFPTNPDATGGWTAVQAGATSPFDVTDIWSDGGTGAPATGTKQATAYTYEWVPMNLIAEPTILKGEIFGIALKNTNPNFTSSAAADRFGVWGGATTVTNGWKFYVNGNTNVDPDGGPETAGWWPRKFAWDFVAEVEITGDLPPEIASYTKLSTTLSTGPQTVSATITDINPGGGAAGVQSAVLKYSIDKGVTYSDIAMSGAGDVYTADIPGQAKGTTIMYQIVATDVNGNSSETAVVTYLIFNSLNPTLVVFNGYSAISGYPPSYYFGYNGATANASEIITFPRDRWAYGALTKELVDNYTNIFEITTSGPKNINSDVIKEWLAASPTHNYLLAGDEWLGTQTNWTNKTYVPGDFQYDVLGVEKDYNDVSYAATGDEKKASLAAGVAGTTLGDSLHLKVVALNEDSLLINPTYELGAAYSNWLDGFDPVSGTVVDVTAVGKDGATYNVGAHRTLAAGNKVAFLAFDPLSLDSPGDSYFWYGFDRVSPLVQVGNWFGIWTAAAPTVEFRANMSVQLKKGTFSTGDKVFVRGDFNGWGGTDYELTDVDGDSVYSAVFSNFTLGQKIIFKYTNNHGGADVWESTGNREINVVGGPNVYTACWEDVCIYVPSKTIQVAFSVNMELERLSGLFKPASDTVSVRGSFNGWGQTVMTASPTNVDIYEVVTPVIAAVGEKVNFKFFYTPGTWEVNQLTDPTQDNRYFVVSQADFDAASLSYEGSFNNGSLETVLNQPANIKFTCNTNGASIINAPQGTEFKTVHMAGGNSPLAWPGGGWPDADITLVKQLYDDGTNGDAVSGDKIFTTILTFPQYATLNVVYKYGANWGLPTNGGANDNEAGVGSDKTLKMGRYTANATVVDTFGIVHTTDVTKVEKLGNTIPTVYMLEQNYPNPFNPETSIRFSVPQESFVTVKVFNTLGEEVMTLVNEEKSAGVYNVSFQANSLTSGIYFYTIKANDFTSTKKMILMK
ncbi:MAG: T9SS type A sorting domain-containing protein [Ignavibacteriaceae bacterium]|nr:T9SS type A sorting domain-containing protein [Ignavibacteriaceae bacterium]